MDYVYVEEKWNKIWKDKEINSFDKTSDKKIAIVGAGSLLVWMMRHCLMQ